jgi:hypothetical protein
MPHPDTQANEFLNVTCRKTEWPGHNNYDKINVTTMQQSTVKGSFEKPAIVGYIHLFFISLDQGSL